jgi:CubicO group peptidase (beta-lactamase class C family)
MYETLSYLPELLLNQTYESYVAQHLFEPLNMTSTTFSITDIDAYPPQGSPVGVFAHRMADGHVASNRDLTLGKLGSLKPIVPFFSRPGEERTRAEAGGIISARDLTTWNAMLSNAQGHPPCNIHPSMSGLRWGYT